MSEHSLEYALGHIKRNKNIIDGKICFALIEDGGTFNHCTPKHCVISRFKRKNCPNLRCGIDSPIIIEKLVIEVRKERLKKLLDKP